jgi:hypothetical protein
LYLWVIYRQREKTDWTFLSRRRLFEEGFIVKLRGTFLALFFMPWPMCPLAVRVAIFDQIASRACFEAIAALAACGTLRRTRGSHLCICMLVVGLEHFALCIDGLPLLFPVINDCDDGNSSRCYE